MSTIKLDGDTKREEMVCRLHDVYYDPEQKICALCALRARVKELEGALEAVQKEFDSATPQESKP